MAVSLEGQTLPGCRCLSCSPSSLALLCGRELILRPRDWREQLPELELTAVFKKGLLGLKL